MTSPRLKRLRARLHAVASRHFDLRGEKEEYRAFLAGNFGGRESSLDLSARELAEAIRLLGGHSQGGRAPSPGEVSAGKPGKKYSAGGASGGKVVSLQGERSRRRPATEKEMAQLYAYAERNLGWSWPRLRREIVERYKKDIRDKGREPDVLTHAEVTSLLGAMRALYRHHHRPGATAPGATAPAEASNGG